jgi:hypothetical protein
MGGLRDGSRPLASAAAGAGNPAASAAAAPSRPWQQHFEVAPGSILRVDLGQAAADLKVKVGEHEGIQLSSNAPLLAEQAPHPERTSSTLGACMRAIGRHAGRWLGWTNELAGITAICSS